MACVSGSAAWNARRSAGCTSAVRGTGAPPTRPCARASAVRPGGTALSGETGTVGTDGQLPTQALPPPPPPTLADVLVDAGSTANATALASFLSRKAHGHALPKRSRRKQLPDAGAEAAEAAGTAGADATTGAAAISHTSDGEATASTTSADDTSDAVASTGAVPTAEGATSSPTAPQPPRTRRKARSTKTAAAGAPEPPGGIAATAAAPPPDAAPSAAQTTTTAAAELTPEPPAATAPGAPASPAASGDARARVSSIKADLMRAMRSQLRSPTAASVNLILSPVAAPPQQPAQPPPGVEPLRAESLPPRPPRAKPERGRSSDSGARADGAEGAEARERSPGAGRGGARGREGRRGGERGGAGAAAAGAAAREAGGAPRGRVLKTKAVRQVEAAARRVLEAAEAEARAGREEAEAEAAASAAAAAERQQQRQAELQRANEEYASFIERAAERVAAVRRRDGDAGPGPSARSAGSSRSGSPQAQQAEAQAKGQQGRSESDGEQADLLRGLAQAFRNFSRQQPSPQAAAAAVAAAVPAAAATASAAAFAPDAATAVERVLRSVGLSPRNPSASSGGGSGSSAGSAALGASPARAADVKLILQPLASHGEGGAPEGAVDPSQALRAKPLPTRADLLRALRPMPRSALPTYTRKVGLRLVSRRRAPKELRLRAPHAGGATTEEGAEHAEHAEPQQQLLSDGEYRALRRRLYFRRVLQRRAAAAGGGAAENGGGGEGGEGEGEAGSSSGATAPEKSQARSRRYALSTRSFVLKQRVQYSDTLKRVVRKASLSRAGGAGAAAAAVGASSSSSSGAQRRGAEEEDAGEGEEGADGGPRGDYVPEAEVVNDVYEQVMGVRLPRKALYGARAQALAALSAKDVTQQARAWVQACGKEYALAFHAREPLLLTQPPQALLLSLESLSRALSLLPEECVALALRSPQLIGVPLERLEVAVADVSEALRVGQMEAGRIAMRCPGLVLHQEAFPVTARLELLGALLPVSGDKLRQVVRQRPQLLSKSLESLASFMMAASAVLGRPLFDVSLMVAGAPGVVGVSAARMGARWQALQAGTALHAAWAQQLADASPPSLGRCLTANEAAIGRLQAVVEAGLADEPDFVKFKRVLTMSSARFEALMARAGGGAGPARPFAAHSHAPLAGADGSAPAAAPRATGAASERGVAVASV